MPKYINAEKLGIALARDMFNTYEQRDTGKMPKEVCDITISAIQYAMEMLSGSEPVEIEEILQSEWIPVGERLPEQNIDNSSKDVLVAIRYRYDRPGDEETICTGYLLRDKWWVYTAHDCSEIGKGSYEGNVVTHWMPLPEPPKEVQ